MRRLILSLACGALLALPVLAQQPGSEPSVLERIDGAVRGFLNSIFGSGENRPGEPAQTPKPKPDAEQRPAPPAATPAQSVAPSPAAAFKGTPVVRAADRGLHDAIARDDYESALKMIGQGADIEAKYGLAMRKLGVEPGMLSSEAGHA